jgi:predicted DNA-binding transcriptional regulator AlpA
LSEPFILPNAPDFQVLSDAQTCAITGLSADTLKRLDQLGQAPKRVQLSPRRHGRTVGAIRAWLAEREQKSFV